MGTVTVVKHDDLARDKHQFSPLADVAYPDILLGLLGWQAAGLFKSD